jgi:coenzyme F420-reducing hydrogenase alpha subunit
VLRAEHHQRLAEIAGSLRGAAERVAALLRDRILVTDELLGGARAIDAGPLASLALARDGALVLRDGRGAELERFPAAATFEKIALRREPWSHEPFAFVAARGWDGVDAAPGGGAFFVGPLARLAGGEPLETPLAEAERQRLVAALGAPPRVDVAAAGWALAVELLGAAEALVGLCDPEKLSGPAPRTIPSARGTEGYAALESPAGLVALRLRADARGLVEAVQVLDAAAANNALSGVVARRAVEAAVAERLSWDETKKRVELALLAW